MTEWIQADGMWHTQACLSDFEQYERAKAKYEKRWPNYCRQCGGAGGHWYSFDPSPAGVSLASGTMEDFDPCSECAEGKGVCPRCGEKMHEDWWQDDEPCPRCGWNWCHDEGDALPELPECWCWERDDFPGWSDVEHQPSTGVYAEFANLYQG